MAIRMTKGQLSAYTAQRLLDIRAKKVHDISTIQGLAKGKMENLVQRSANYVQMSLSSTERAEMGKPAGFMDYAKSYGKVAWGWLSNAIPILKSYVLKFIVRKSLNEQFDKGGGPTPEESVNLLSETVTQKSKKPPSQAQQALLNYQKKGSKKNSNKSSASKGPGMR